MGSVLGRVITGAADGPRGPDVLYRIRVPQAWLNRGATVDIALPRNVSCARCEGGGCDSCERSGAITLRDRDVTEPPLTLALPRKEKHGDEAEGPTLVLRVPDRGGVGGPGEARGLLLLHVFAAAEADASVTLAALDRGVPGEPDDLEAEESLPMSRRARAAMILAIAVVAWILFYVMLRLAQLV